MKKRLFTILAVALISTAWSASAFPVPVTLNTAALGNAADTNSLGANVDINKFSANGPAIPRDAQVLASDLRANMDRLRPMLSQLAGGASNGPVVPTPLTSSSAASAASPAMVSQILPVLQNVRVESQELLTRLTQLDSANIGAASSFSGTQTGSNASGTIVQGINIISQPMTNTYGTVTNKVGGFINRLVGAVSNEFSAPKTNSP